MSDPTLDAYVRSVQDADWLGQLVIYSVSEINFKHADLDSLLTRHGLGDFVPRAPGDIDVFRRAITAVQVKRVETSREGVYANVLTRDVTNDSDELVKRLVLETVDGAGRRLEYSAFFDWVLNKKSKQADVIRLSPNVIDADLQALADAKVKEGIDRFDQLRGTIDAAAIRGVIHRLLTDSSATSLRPGGGCYFMLPEKRDVTRALEEIGSFIPGTMVHTIPVVDDDKQRSLVQAAVEAEAESETAAIRKTIEEFAEVIRSGRDVSAEKFATLNRRYRMLVEKADRYKATLETDLVVATSSIEIVKLQMAQLAGVATKGAAAKGAA